MNSWRLNETGFEIYRWRQCDLCQGVGSTGECCWFLDDGDVVCRHACLDQMKRVGRGKEVDRFGLVGGRGGMYPERKENRVRRRPCKGSRMGLEVEETAGRQEGVGRRERDSRRGKERKWGMSISQRGEAWGPCVIRTVLQAGAVFRL